MAKALTSWGSWVEQRAEFVGFRRQADFAAAVGCGRTQLAKWFAMRTPPKQMRKGFDRWLANALQTTHRTLFLDYVNVPPEKAAVLGHVAHHPGIGTFVNDIDWTRTEPLLNEVIARLDGDERNYLLEQALMLVLAKHDERAAEFKRYQRQHEGDEDLPDMSVVEDPGKLMRFVDRRKKPTKR